MEKRVYVYTRMALGRQMDSSDAPAEWEDLWLLLREWEDLRFGWNENALVEMDAANWESSYWKLKVNITSLMGNQIVGIVYILIMLE